MCRKTSLERKGSAIFFFVYLFLLIQTSCGDTAQFKGNPASLDVGKYTTFSQSFPAAIVGDNAVTFQPAERRVTQEISLLKADPTTLTLQQVTRPRHKEIFNQGHDGAPAHSNFNISEGKKLDLLLLVDDSYSMEAQQEKLAAKLEPLLSKLQDVNWRIAVVTTSSSCLRLNRVIEKSDTDYLKAFQNAVKAGTGGDDVEMGIKMSIKGLKGECLGQPTKPWIRDASTVAVLLLTDEDNCGRSENWTDPTIRPRWEQCFVDSEGGQATLLVDYLKQIRPSNSADPAASPTEAKIYGLYWQPNSNDCDYANMGSFGQRAAKYADIVNTTKGISGCVYNSDYAGILQSISENVANIVRTQFPISDIPDPGTLKVFVDSKEIQTPDYELVGKTITLKKFDPAAKVIDINYIVGAEPKTSVFPLKAAPVASTLTVEMKVSGVITDPGAYQIQASPRAIAFDTLPPDRANITLKYHENIPLKDVFDLGSIDIDDTEPINVAIDSVPVNDFQIDTKTNLLAFPAPPADGAEINLSYRRPEDTVEQYKAIPDASLAETITVVDFDTHAPIQAVLKEGDLILLRSDIIDDRKILVTYDFGVLKNMSFKIPTEPLSHSIQFTVGTTPEEQEKCKDFSITDDLVVSFVCPIEPMPAVRVDYKYIMQEFREFKIDLGSNPKITPKLIQEGAWKVFVDDREIDTFSISGTTVIIPEDVTIDPWATIKVVLGLWLPTK